MTPSASTTSTTEESSSSPPSDTLLTPPEEQDSPSQDTLMHWDLADPLLSTSSHAPHPPSSPLHHPHPWARLLCLYSLLPPRLTWASLVNLCGNWRQTSVSVCVSGSEQMCFLCQTSIFVPYWRNLSSLTLHFFFPTFPPSLLHFLPVSKPGNIWSQSQR